MRNFNSEKICNSHKQGKSVPEIADGRLYYEGVQPEHDLEGKSRGLT